MPRKRTAGAGVRSVEQLSGGRRRRISGPAGGDDAVTAFAFETSRRVLCEDGACARLGEHASALGARRVLLVTDPGLAQAGLLDVALAGLKATGVSAAVFDAVAADPPEATVEAAAEAARAADADTIVGFGGGSSLDTAKLAALLARSPQSLAEIYGIEQARGPRLPLIQVPTTAGTGSEVTPIAIVTTPGDEKKGVVSRLLLPDLAILDATLTLELPARITAMTGIDAVVHAVEAYTSRLKKNPVSDALAFKALQLLTGAILAAVGDGRDLDARRAMLQGAMLAGMAFANAPVGAVHALAYPLGGRFHVLHGLSNALVLAPVLAFNLPVAAPDYAELARALPPGLADDRLAGGERLVAGLTALVAAMPMERRLSEVGVGSDDVPMLAADAMNVQRLLVNNPREVTLADAVAIYEAAL
jgi:alcohol dehydrogenase class IV